MLRIAFTVRSRYAPDQPPYTGILEYAEGGSDFEILDEIFQRGGNHPTMEHFTEWAQPSVSVGDVVWFHRCDEGVLMVYGYECANVGWASLNPDDCPPGELDRFASVDSDYAFALAKQRVARADLSAKVRRGLKVSR